MQPEIIAAFGGLTAAIGVLWIRLEAANSSMNKKLDKCEQDRLDLWKELAKKTNT
jgi:hypothetical protein